MKYRNLLFVFFWTLLCLGQTVLAAETSSAPNCTDRQVVEFVCGDHFGLHHRDDTGNAYSFQEFPELTRGLSLHTKITNEGYTRFQRAFESVVSAYKNYFSKLPPGRDRGYYFEQLKNLIFPSQQYLDTNPALSYILGANGMYNSFRHRIMITPEILNAPNLSSIELELLIAHELGHYFDPNQRFLNVFIEAKINPRSKILTRPLNACFEQNFTQSGGEATFEDYADWMAAQVLPGLTDSTDERVQLARILDLGYVMCQKPFQSKIGKFFSDQGSDAHALWSERILTFVGAPELLATMGCGPKIIRSDSSIPLSRCTLDKKDST